jgi:hypothetical protein
LNASAGCSRNGRASMRQLFSKAELRTVSSVLAVVLLLSSIPLTSGIVLVSGPSQPELTINICQPLQGFDRLSNPSLARPALNVPLFVLSFLGSLRAKAVAVVSERNVAPDTPPPKRLV